MGRKFNIEWEKKRLERLQAASRVRHKADVPTMITTDQQMQNEMEESDGDVKWYKPHQDGIIGVNRRKVDFDKLKKFLEDNEAKAI